MFGEANGRGYSGGMFNAGAFGSGRPIGGAFGRRGFSGGEQPGQPTMASMLQGQPAPESTVPMIPGGVPEMGSPAPAQQMTGFEGPGRYQPFDPSVTGPTVPMSMGAYLNPSIKPPTPEGPAGFMIGPPGKVGPAVPFSMGAYLNPAFSTPPPMGPPELRRPPAVANVAAGAGVMG